MNRIESTREELESQIVDTADQIWVDRSKSDWIQSQEFDDFIEAWRMLAYWHGQNTDAVIGMEAIKEYVNFSVIFRKMMLNERLTPEDRERAESGLGRLNIWLNEALTMGISNLYDDTI